MLSWNDYKSWLAPVLAGPLPAGPIPAVTDWSTDSRTIAKGQWFVPIVGANFDGHDYITQSLERGAAGFLYAQAHRHKVFPGLESRGIAVRDTLAAFQLITAGWRNTLTRLKVLALTGSAGKTTTKEMLSRILAAVGPTCNTDGSFNNEIGVPKTLQRLTERDWYAALEFGARNPGDIRNLCVLARPNVAALINVGTAHLGIFGSAAALLAAKLEIFSASPEGAVLVANSDDSRIVQGALKTNKVLLTFGQSASADVRLQSTEQTPDGRMAVHLLVCGQKCTGRLGIAHEKFGMNAAAAATMAYAAGVSTQDIAAGLNGFNGVPGRYQIHRTNRYTVVDDAYNANPESMAAGLATFTNTFPNEARVVVLGDMLELGAASESEHAKIGALCAASVRPAMLYTVGKEARRIGTEAIAQGLPKEQVSHFESVDELLKRGLEQLVSKKLYCIYAKASNGIGLSKFVQRLLEEVAA